MSASDASSAKDAEKGRLSVPAAGVDKATAFVSECNPEYERFLELDAQFQGASRAKFIRKRTCPCSASLCLCSSPG